MSKVDTLKFAACPEDPNFIFSPRIEEKHKNDKLLVESCFKLLNEFTNMYVLLLCTEDI